MPESLSSALAAVLDEARASLESIASEDEVREEIARRDRAVRADRIWPHRRMVTDADFRRIVRDELDTPAAGIVKRFLEAPLSNPRSRLLWLAGGVGVGKTVAALSAIAAGGGRIASADQVRRAYGQEHDDARSLRIHLEECGLLVVDDVGTARDAEGERRALYELVNARQGGGRKTILTGNLGKPEIESRYDSRLLSRVAHIGAIVDCGTVSLRGGRS